MPPKEKEESVFVLDAKTKEDDKLVCEKGSYYNQEKWLKDDKASAEPIETTVEWSFSELFRPRSRQASDKVTRGPAPYKNQTKDIF